MRARQINSYFNQLGEGLGRSCRRRSPRSPASRCRSPSRRSRPTRSFERVEPPEDADGRASVEPPSGDADDRRRRRGLSRPQPMLRRASASSSASPAGIAAYKAVEVCRRLVDAGAHVVAGADRRAPSASSARTTFSALASRAGAARRCGTTPTRSRTPASARRPTSSSSRPATARLLGAYAAGHLRRPAHRHAARHPGAGARLPGDAHRDVGAPGGAGEPRHAAPPRRARRRARGGPPRRRRRRRRPPRRPRARSSPRSSASSAPRGPRRARACSSPPAAPASRSTPVRVIANRSSGKQGYAIAAEAAAAGRQVTLVTTVDAAGAAGRRGRRGRDRGRDGATRCWPRPTTPTSS